jgi:hypothetical protein
MSNVTKAALWIIGFLLGDQLLMSQTLTSG